MYWNLISVLFGESRVYTTRLRSGKHEREAQAPAGPVVHRTEQVTGV